MTVAVMKALHSPIPLILDALFASFPPHYLPHAPPPSGPVCGGPGMGWGGVGVNLLWVYFHWVYDRYWIFFCRSTNWLRLVAKHDLIFVDRLRPFL